MPSATYQLSFDMARNDCAPDVIKRLDDTHHRGIVAVAIGMRRRGRKG